MRNRPSNALRATDDDERKALIGRLNAERQRLEALARAAAGMATPELRARLAEVLPRKG